MQSVLNQTILFCNPSMNALQLPKHPDLAIPYQQNHTSVATRLQTARMEVTVTLFVQLK